MLALGVVLISRTQGYTVDLTAFLFGDVLGVGGSDSWSTAVLTVAIIALVALLYRPFLLLSFDRQRAAALGLPVDRLELVMLVVITLAVVVGFRVVGALLVLGMLIAPPAAAALVTKRLPAMMAALRRDRRDQRPDRPAALLAPRHRRRRLDRPRPRDRVHRPTRAPPHRRRGTLKSCACSARPRRALRSDRPPEFGPGYGATAARG